MRSLDERRNPSGQACTMCKKPMERRIKKTCDVCLTRIKHWGQRTRADRRLAGLCPHCGKPKGFSSLCCDPCLAKAKNRYQNRKRAGLCVLCGAKHQKLGSKCMECALKSSQRLRDWRDRLIVEVMKAYGGCVCKCCGEKEVAFLTLDHINGGGRQHRSVLRKQKTADIYSWLKQENYPPGFQVLCMNCNWAKGKYGVCPHKQKVRRAKWAST